MYLYIHVLNIRCEKSVGADGEDITFQYDDGLQDSVCFYFIIISFSTNSSTE